MAMRLGHLLFTLGCLALLIPRWIKKRGSWRQDLGFGPHPRKVQDFLMGCLFGTLAMFFVFGIEWLCGWLRPGPFNRAGWAGLDILPPLMLMALWEEFRFRGIELSGLRTILPPWGALVLSSVVFGVAHCLNANATWLSILGNMLGGFVYGYAFLVSGAIWLSFGLHAAWNMVQGPILGLPISGYLEGGLWNPTVSGPEFLTGGNYGPEAGLVGLAAHILILALLWAYHRKQRPEFTGEPTPKELPC